MGVLPTARGAFYDGRNARELRRYVRRRGARERRGARRAGRS